MPFADSKQRFSNRVADYVRYRPGYPTEVITLLRSECGLRFSPWERSIFLVTPSPPTHSRPSPSSRPGVETTHRTCSPGQAFEITKSAIEKRVCIGFERGSARFNVDPQKSTITN